MISPGEVFRRDRRDVLIASTWLYIVAACTLLNSVIIKFGRYIDFYAGLFMTQAIDAAATGLSTIEPEHAVLRRLIPLFALAGDIVLVGILAALGMLAARNVRGAFIAGIVWYGVDTLLLVLTLLISLTWIPVTVHLMGMVLLVRGFLARNRLVAANRPARAGL